MASSFLFLFSFVRVRMLVQQSEFVAVFSGVGICKAPLLGRRRRKKRRRRWWRRGQKKK
jgi:hypothetical protein